jgi:hypothetical protein
MKKIILFLLFTNFIFCQDINKDLDAYYQLGIKNVAENWDLIDYKNATEIILNKKNDSIGYPNFKNSSGKILEKLISFNSYPYLNIDNLELVDKVKFSTVMGSLVMQLYNKIYITKSNDKLIYSKELTYVIKSLYDNIKFCFNSRELYTKENQVIDSQRNGSAKMDETLPNIIEAGFLCIKTEYNSFKKEDVCHLAEIQKDIYLSLSKYLSPENKNKLDLMKSYLEKNHPYPCVKNTFSK